MQQELAVETMKNLALSGSGTALAASLTLSEQLNKSYVFLNLELPYWFFLTLMVVLNFVGAFFALKTDYMKANGSRAGNFATAAIVGLFISFIVLPVVQPESTVGVMLIASFVSGLCGTIFLRIIINIINREDLQDELVDLGAGSITMVIKYLKKWRDKILGGGE